MKIPEHIAIIMDGNGRWARKRGLPRFEGHRRGINNVKKIAEYAQKLGVKVLTLFCFSTENWNRPPKEVDFLMNHLDNFLEREIDNLKKNGVRLKVIGERYMLPQRLQDKIKRSEELTSGNKDFVLNLAISYGSQQEIVNAAKMLCRDVLEGRLSLEDVSLGVFSHYLYTADLPSPDLLIRTSGELRISNFLLWQISYTELYFTKVCWPDFGRLQLKKAIEEYSRRERRFGKVTG